MDIEIDRMSFKATKAEIYPTPSCPGIRGNNGWKITRFCQQTKLDILEIFSEKEKLRMDANSRKAIAAKDISMAQTGTEHLNPNF